MNGGQGSEIFVSARHETNIHESDRILSPPHLIFGNIYLYRGRLAQLVEHFIDVEGVTDSSSVPPTNLFIFNNEVKRIYGY